MKWWLLKERNSLRLEHWRRFRLPRLKLFDDHSHQLSSIMPRRPRPTTRQPPNSTKPTTKKVGPKQQHAKIPPTKLQSSSEDDSDEVSINHFDESTLVVNTGSGSSAGGSEDEGAEGLDVDAPRVAQWEPDEFDLYGSASDDEDSGDDMQEELSSRAGPSHEKLVCRINLPS